MFVFIEELLAFLVGFLLEIAADLLGTVVLELGLRGLVLPFSSERALPWWFAALAYTLCGGLLGYGSILLFPTAFLTNPAARIAHVALAPVLIGLSMAAVGHWTAKRALPSLRLETFAMGWLFGLAASGIRLLLT